MRAIYLDSSAFVKLFVEEAESVALRAHLATQDTRFVSSGLLRTESLRAVWHLGPEALALIREGLRRIDLIALDDRILDTAGILAPEVMRTIDAIHLATALAVGDDIETIVTYDSRMIESARVLGLSTASPGSGPAPDLSRAGLTPQPRRQTLTPRRPKGKA